MLSCMMLCLVSADQHGELRPGPGHLRQVGHHRGGGRGADQRLQAGGHPDIPAFRYLLSTLHMNKQIQTVCCRDGGGKEEVHQEIREGLQVLIDNDIDLILVEVTRSRYE